MALIGPIAVNNKERAVKYSIIVDDWTRKIYLPLTLSSAATSSQAAAFMSASTYDYFLLFWHKIGLIRTASVSVLYPSCYEYSWSHSALSLVIAWLWCCAHTRVCVRTHAHCCALILRQISIWTHPLLETQYTISTTVDVLNWLTRYASPCLWNQLPSSLRQPHFNPSVFVLPVHAPTTSSHSVNSPLSPSITPSLFHSRLKTYLFHKSFPP